MGRRNTCGQLRAFRQWNDERLLQRAKQKYQEEQRRLRVERDKLVGWDAEGRECTEYDYRYVPPPWVARKPPEVVVIDAQRNEEDRARLRAVMQPGGRQRVVSFAHTAMLVALLSLLPVESEGSTE